MTKETIKCVKCDELLKSNIAECTKCHDKYCYNCSLDYMVWYGNKKLCKKCALENPADWTKQMDIHIDKTDEPLK